MRILGTLTSTTFTELKDCNLNGYIKKAKAHRSVTMISLGGSKLDHVLIFLKATFPLLNDEMNECFYGYCHHYFLNVCASQPKCGL